MFLKRQKLDMRKTHFQDVVRKRPGHFAIAERPILFSFNLTTPRSEVNFIDRQRLAKVFATGAFLHPLGITKPVVRLEDYRRSIRRDLSIKRVRISFKKGWQTRRLDLVFIKFA